MFRRRFRVWRRFPASLSRGLGTFWKLPTTNSACRRLMDPPARRTRSKLPIWRPIVLVSLGMVFTHSDLVMRFRITILSSLEWVTNWRATAAPRSF